MVRELFGAERGDRIEARRFARRDPTGEQRDDGEHSNGEDESWNVVRLEAKEHGSGDARGE